MALIWIPLITLALGTAALIVALPLLARRTIRAVLSRPLSDTLAELYVSSQSTTPLKMIYLSQRAESGGPVIRPMGSAHPVHGLDDLALNPAQLARVPLPYTAPVDLSVTLGRRARRPLRLDIPIFVSGMAYGLAVTRQSRLAMAKGTAMAGTALNSGQGPYFAEERKLCRAYILQFGRWTWNRDVEILRQADMLEIQVGQGAQPGNAVIGHVGDVGPEIREMLHIGPEEPPIIHARLFLDRPDRPSTLREVAAYLRGVCPDVPLAVKMGAGDDIEADIDVALAADVDVVVIDGTEGATGNAPVTISDHFGIPTLPALARAARHLRERGADVDLVVSGGLREPGDFLKAIALGADCVAIGTAAMFAIAHPQITATVPFHPPTDLVFYRSHPQIPLDVDAAAQALANYLASCRAEMEIALRTMGRSSLHELSPSDLVAMDEGVARLADVRFVGDARELAPSTGR
ncbi:MAG TPA: FMN-binding glutamate synthase family protein [Bacillota bacterium]|nr:FMN-binding glutamate synthase family protein [Bacillota bacterium]